VLPTDEELIRFIRRRSGVKTRALAAEFGVQSEEIEALAARLLELQLGGEVLRIPGAGWAIPEQTDLRVGVVRVSRRGDAFVTLAKSESEGDLHLRTAAMRDVLDGDVVLAKIASGRRKKDPGRRRKGERERERERGGRPDRLREALVVEIIQRGKELVRGRFWLTSMEKQGDRLAAGDSKGASAGLVKPLASHLSTRIYIAPQDSLGARDGQKVLVRLLDEPSPGGTPRGQVVARISDEGSLVSDFEMIAAEFGFPVDHPSEALAEAEALPAIPGGQVPPSLLAGREDLRELQVFTIDPRDARDFDDAVSLESLPGGGVRLGVHIADVSHYAPPGSALDRSAAARGTSIYLPGRVVPMLPERLSNDLASLRPGEDRLTKTVFLDFDPRGETSEVRIVRSVIRSRRRFAYQEVLAILDAIDRRRGGPAPGRAVYPRDRRGREGDGEGKPASPPPPDAAEYGEVLGAMADLRDRLWGRRRERGALDLDIPRLRLQLDDEGAVVAIDRDERDPSHHLIEEFMLAANEAVARFAGQNGIPLVARVHPPPDEERIEDFFEVLQRTGLSRERKGGSRDLRRVVEATAGDPLAPVIHLALLRSLAHAEYSAEPALHFALATSTYCHFTSPIRRYPDLLVHQALDEYWDGKLAGAERRRSWDEALPGQAESSSRAERRAEEAEREMTKLRLIRHLASRVGEEMEGMVISVQPFGFFVRVMPTLIEGLVHVATLADDYYQFDEEGMFLRGAKRRRTFRIGDRVRVMLRAVDPDFREINFEFLGRLENERKA
jgi:ribonuclease R